MERNSEAVKMEVVRKTGKESSRMARKEQLKAGLYKRISTGEQSKYSLEAQEEQLRAYCRSKGIGVFRVYQDTKGRFTFEDRSGLMCLLDDVEGGRINFLLVTELDRLAGDEGILGYVRYTLKKYGVKLIAVSEENKVLNEYQELIEGILTAVAKFENKRKTLRCRRGIKRAREQGRTLNRCPYGYKVFNKGKKDSKIVVDEEKGRVIKSLFEGFVNGLSMYRLSKKHNLSKSNIRYILRNRFYCDGRYNGVHKPLISVELFNKANKQ